MMEELLKRGDDLRRRAERRAIVTHTAFLTPAESYTLERYGCGDVFSGGGRNCERRMAFFLPDYMEPEHFDESEYISALKVETRFAKLGHRDFLGALMGLGITREAVGDIIVLPETAYIFCQPTAADFAVLNLDKVGRYGAKTVKIPLSEVPEREIKKEKVSFTVMSPRLDAVVAGMFGISRTSGAKLIEGGYVSVNYAECLKTDREVSEGDIISARGYGKGVLAGRGGQSRRGRIFLNAEIYK